MKKLLFLISLILFIPKVSADSIQTQDVTWYYRNTTNESVVNNSVVEVNTGFIASASSNSNQNYLNGFTTRVSSTFNSGIQYNLNYTLTMAYDSDNDTNFRSDTISRLQTYSYVDSDFTLIGSTANQIGYQCVGGVCSRLFSISISVKCNNNTDAIRFGVYTTNNVSLGFYTHYVGSLSGINYKLSNTTSITENSNSVIIGQNETIINQNNEMMQQNEQNTQDIINANNENTQAIIDSNYTCTTYDSNKIYQTGRRLTSSGGTATNSDVGITSYIPVNENYKFKILSNINYYYCFYSNNNTSSTISCNLYSSSDPDTYTSIPANAKYMRITIPNTSTGVGSLCQKSSDAINDSLNDDSIDTSEATDFFSNFDTDTFGLTSIVTAPLTLIQSLTSSTCSDLELPLPYLDNKKITLPCMTAIYQQHFGSFLTLYQTITYGIVAYWVIVRIFNQVKDFKNPEHDEIEVMDL